MAEKNVNVKVILHAPGSSPPYHFESDDLPIDKDNVIYFSNCGKSKGFMVHYDLDDGANPGYRFPTNQTNGNDYLDKALWVAQSSSCPTRQCKWDVFEAKSVEKGGLTLVVRNKNETAADFAYTLRVIKGTTWLDLDPGGSNQNGGIPFTTLASAVVTGAVVGLGSAVLASNAFDAPTALIYMPLAAGWSV